MVYVRDSSLWMVVSRQCIDILARQSFFYQILFSGFINYVCFVLINEGFPTLYFGIQVFVLYQKG